MQTINKQVLEWNVCRFGGPKAPPIPKPPLANQAAGNVNADITADGRKRMGANSTILTSGLGVSDQTSKKTILGG